MSFFKNKRVWITGASSGIGEALAYAFAEKGAHLILSARNEQELNRVATACVGAASVFIQPLDLSKHDTIQTIADTVLKKVGKIDILLNNGGISQRSLAHETTLEVDKKLMDVNYFGTVALTRAVLPNMLLHQLGHIVTITSLMGKFGAPLRSSYAASKHALHGFFDSLRSEIGDTPIQVTMICPGFVRTNISMNALTAGGVAQGTMDNATDKGMAPERLAEKILKAIEKGKLEAYFGGKEVFGVYLKRFVPTWFAGYLKGAKVV
jgi:dehydrogenase/reductase SDR family member 7B